MAFTDEQKLILHMCIQASKAGYENAWISRQDIMSGNATPSNAPASVLVKIMWAALSMPDGVLEWSPDQSRFRLTESAMHSILKSAERRRLAERSAV